VGTAAVPMGSTDVPVDVDTGLPSVVAVTPPR
jgi:hypothetical protein